ncbi:hypothetical protein MTR62_10960 [Novosphingobium sp. 1949]|uniref:Uncharacterized protein n=1 Tax=Novosphingobium organovorum TaxID=2930092 RepID=A0ABT0BDT4_9SPHN|nr:hypothetical protein [Novosphingobium organovorum]MCJ2183208.1 hypothetical protein [Novosphingobium organovorum]
MQIAITKGRGSDRVAIVRADGSRAQAQVVHKGILPHDAVHFFVERGLGLKRGFWGLLAEGHHPDDLARLACEAGHASAARAQVPQNIIVELLQAERLVECFEADAWSGAGDNAALGAMAQAGCAASHVPLPALRDEDLDRVREALTQFGCEWMDAPVGFVARLTWA